MPLSDINLPQIGRSIQMVGTVYADQSDAWMVMLPGEPDPSASRPIRPVVLSIEEWIEFLRQADLVEVKALVKDSETGHIAKAMMRKSTRQISQRISWQVFRRDDFRCRYCGEDQMPLTVDHLITWESGGPSIPENLVASCSRCNNARGETLYTEWLLDPYYKKVSAKMDYQAKFANQALVPTLATIPVTPLKDGKKRSRR